MCLKHMPYGARNDYFRKEKTAIKLIITVNHFDMFLSHQLYFQFHDIF